MAIGTVPAAEQVERAAWAPAIVVALAQLLLAFNLTTLKVSIEAVADALDTPASRVKTAIVVHTLVVAGLIMLGARIKQRVGARRVFRTAVAAFGAAMVLMAVCRSAPEMMLAQALAGAASAALIPTLVATVAENYHGDRRAQALGWLAGTQTLGIVAAFLIAGSLAASVDWRVTFGVLAVFSGAIYFASGKLRGADGSRSAVHIDTIGVALAATAMLLVGIGADKLAAWGVWRARPGAPFGLFDLSPAPAVIVAGVVLLQAFLVWSKRCRAAGRMPLIAPEVLGTSRERCALLSIFVIALIGAGLTFLIPLYIEVVQGRTSLYTAVALVPFTLANFAAAIVIVRFRARVSPRRAARFAFLIVAGGLALLGVTVRNDWGDSGVVLSLTMTGIGEGALGALLLKLLAAAAPRDAPEDVGSVCGCTSFFGAGVGTALAGALLAVVLGATVQRHVAENPLISAEIRAEVDLDSVSFMSNDLLARRLARAAATPEQLEEAVRINTEARLVALRASFYALAVIALLAFFPAAGVREIRDEGGEAG